MIGVSVGIVGGESVWRAFAQAVPPGQPAQTCEQQLDQAQRAAGALCEDLHHAGALEIVEIVEGVIVKVDRDEVLLDIGYKMASALDMILNHDLLHCDIKPGNLMLDLNGFKAINDTHGHLQGDQVLQLISRELRRAVPESTAICRWGGDEFVLVLQNLGKTAVKAIVAAIQRNG